MEQAIVPMRDEYEVLFNETEEYDAKYPDRTADEILNDMESFDGSNTFFLPSSIIFLMHIFRITPLQVKYGEGIIESIF